MTLTFFVRGNEVLATLDSKKFSLGFDGEIYLKRNDIIIAYVSQIDSKSTFDELYPICKHAIGCLLLQSSRRLQFELKEVNEILRDIDILIPSLTYVISKWRD